MKTWVFYILTFLYASSATPLSEVYKLPVFFSHFIEHNKGGDFIEEMQTYIVHHYGGHEKDGDWETDQKLPFMMVEINHSVQISLPEFTYFFPNIPELSYQEPMVFFDDDVRHFNYLDSIWQPPRQA